MANLGPIHLGTGGAEECPRRHNGSQAYRIFAASVFMFWAFSQA